MRNQSNYSQEEKIIYVQKILNGEESIQHLAKVLECSSFTITLWLNKYQMDGVSGLADTSQNKRYSADLKQSAVNDYLLGLGSYTDICKKYKISSTTQLRKWVLKYNSHEKLKASGTGGTPIMTRGRVTKYEERIEIIKYCIEHERNYAETAEIYHVSYQQVYTWMKKYESKGVEGLLDHRGQKKPESEMSEVEKLRAENRLLKAENKRQEMEMAFLKKLNEIERRRF